MADLNVVATEVFLILRSFNYIVRPYDENGMEVTEPADARRMMCYGQALPAPSQAQRSSDAQKAAGRNNLMVSLVDDDDNSRITLNFGKSVNINDIMGLDQKLRITATKYNMIFKAQRYGTEITPKNFAELASVSEDIEMQVCEGMYGTSRSSYLRMENAKMIVRHKSRIDDSKIGARGRCVESVFVENRLGERSRMPTNNLMAGRAMTQHVNQGGSFADPVGQQINGMAMEYSNLGAGAGAAMAEAAGIVREACKTKMGKLRKTFERLARPGSYAAEAEALGQNMLTETQIEETRLAEVRQLLNGGVSEEVIECCCKAMDEMKQSDTKELAENNGVIAKHLAWLRSFDLLNEMAYSPMDPSFDDAPYDLASESAVSDFDAQEFVDSPQMQDVISGREPNSDDNHLTKDDVMGALNAYMRHYIDIYHPDVIGGFDNTTSMADAVYDSAVNALQDRGYVVDDATLAEDADELTIEDVLLPKKDQGDDLAHEVEPTDVADPTDPHHGPADTGYKQRLLTLAGMRTDPI